jgi:hypothetical protein
MDHVAALLPPDVRQIIPSAFEASNCLYVVCLKYAFDVFNAYNRRKKVLGGPKSFSVGINQKECFIVA